MKADDDANEPPHLHHNAGPTAMNLDEVLDSDDDEALEELAERQETSYWSAVDTSLQDDEPMPVDVAEAIQGNHQDALEAPVLIHEEVLQEDEEFLLPPELVRTIQPSSPDPLDLLRPPDQGYPASIVERDDVLAPDEHYGMPFGEMVPLALSPVIPNEPTMPMRRSATSPPPSRKRTASESSEEDLPTIDELLGRAKGTLSSVKRTIATPSIASASASPFLPPPLKAPSSIASSRSASASLAITSGSTGPTSPATHQQARHTSEDASLAQALAGGRQLRKRTAVQLNPYQAEFAKYVTVAKRNQWDGIIIPAGLNLHKEKVETPEEKAARLEKRKKQKIDTQGGWLELEEGEGQPSSSSGAHPYVHRRSSEQLRGEERHDAARDYHRRSLSTSANKKGKERARDDDEGSSAAQSDLPDDPVTFGRPIKENADRHNLLKKKKRKTLPDANVYSKASTSKVTLDEALAEMQNKARRKISDSSKRRKETSNLTDLPTPIRAGSAPPSSSSPARHTKPPPRGASSAAERGGHKKSRHRNENSSNSLARSQAPPIIDITDSSSSPAPKERTSKVNKKRPDRSVQSDQDSSAEGRSSDEEAGTRAAGDSPDRPFYKDDRFALKGSRKQAARKMMPAIFFKKAAADLNLMREETRAGKEVREVLRCSSDDAGSGEEGQPRNPAMATVRINPRNRDKPIQFVVDESTDESESDNDRQAEESEDERQIEATAAWANVLPVSRTSAATTPVQLRKGKTYWNGVIGNILLRDKLERQTTAGKGAGSSKRRRKKKAPKRAAGDASAARGSKGKERQKRLDHYSIHRPAVQLDDGEALFAALPAPQIPQPTLRARHHPFKRSAPTSVLIDKNAITPQVKQRPQAVPLNQADDLWDETGSTFSRFSYDFDIHRLATGFTFVDDTYICQGGLAELIQLGKPACMKETYKRVCSSFGIHIDSEMSADVLLDLLPRLVENLHSALVDTQQRPRLHSPAGKVLRFLSYYVHERLAHDEAGQKHQAVILEALYELETRLDAWMQVQDADTAAKMHNLIIFRWFMLEIAYRQYVQKLDHEELEKDAKQVLLVERLDELVESLLHIGLGRPVKALKALSASEARANTKFEDELAEIWVCLMHLFSVDGTDGNRDYLTPALLWQTITVKLSQDADKRKLHPILAGEFACYTIMALCVLSQFSAHGMTTPAIRLVPHWTVLAAIVDRIRPAELAKSYSSMVTSSRTRLSRYIWTLFARTHVLSTRWNWPILDQTRFLGKLFDVLNARELQNFAIDGASEYPSYLSDYTGKIDTSLASDDTAFGIYLRILAQAAEEAKADGTQKSKDLLGRLTMRAMPMRQRLPYPRTPASGLVRKDRAVLVNHYALLVLLAAIDPLTAERRFPRFKAILEFSNADNRARQDCLRAILYLGIVYRVEAVDLKSLLGWMVEISDHLKEEYGTLAKQRYKALSPLADKTNTMHNRKSNQDVALAKQQSLMERQQALAEINREMSETAVQMGLLLGAVQQLLKSGPASQGEMVQSVYPPLELLSPSWIKGVLSSPMAYDPVAGTQSLECLRVFLDLRKAARPQPKKVPPVGGDSQDEYGDLDFDYNDPALNDLLGVPAPDQAANSAEQAMNNTFNRVDADFAELIKSDVSPTIYRLLSSITVSKLGGSQDLGVPDIPDREIYIADLVEVWTGCGAVLVENNQRDWSYYMSEFGKESWQRISDVMARYEVGMHFAAGMLEHDPRSYELCRDQLLDILYRCIVWPEPKEAVAALLSSLLNVSPDLYLWRKHGIRRDELTGNYEIEFRKLGQMRQGFLRTVFRNCRDILAQRFHRPAEALEDGLGNLSVIAKAQKLDKVLVYKILGGMLTSMRDHLDLSKQRQTLANQETYGRFCREIVSSLKEEIGNYYANENALPQLRLWAGA